MAWVRGVSVGLERGLAAREQASPLAIPVIGLLALKVAATTDFDTALGVVCATFALVGGLLPDPEA